MSRAKEIKEKIDLLKEKYITAEPNKPFTDAEMENIQLMLNAIQSSSTKDSEMSSLKDALGYDSYLKTLTGDFSEFERVHPVLRNYCAINTEKTHRNVLADIYDRKKWNDPGMDMVADMEMRLYMHNPALRLGMSIMQNDGTGNYSYYRELDDRMIEMTMEYTLNPMTPEQILRVQEMTANPKQAMEMIDTNVEKQVQVAKLMLMAHIGKTQLMKDGQPLEMDRSVSSMMAHCSRTAFVFPPGEKEEVSAMMGRLTGGKKGKSAGIYGRLAATHSTAHGKTIEEFKEKKTISFRHQYGMDIAIGGLGNVGIPGIKGKRQILKNDGTCGHMYMRVDQGGVDKTSSLLIGFESDSPSAPGNQQGHTHDTKATPEYMSSFLAQRTDEMGDKYGGRIVDCTAYTPEELSGIVEKFTAQYRGMVREAMKNPTARIRLEEANKMLSGKLMNVPQLEIFFNKAGFSKEEAVKFTGDVSRKKGITYEPKANQIFEDPVHPIPEVPEPGRRNRIRAFFGSSDAKQKIQEFQNYLKQKQEMDALAAHKAMADLANVKSRIEYIDLQREKERIAREKRAEEVFEKLDHATKELEYWKAKEERRVKKIEESEKKQSMSLDSLMKEEAEASPKRSRPGFKQVRNAFKMDRAAERIQDAKTEIANKGYVKKTEPDKSGPEKK